MGTLTEVRERPIPFSAAMVRAIQSGEKTITRRVIQPQPQNNTCFSWFPPPGITVNHAPGGLWTDTPKQFIQRCRYGSPGDCLWVQEAFYVDHCGYEFGSLRERPADVYDDMIYYRADGECCNQIPECQCATEGKPRWRPPRFMPRWASRITLQVVDVQVERLQEITVPQIKAEGIIPKTLPYQAAIAEWIATWDAINSDRGFEWESNPWVWVVSFQRIGK